MPRNWTENVADWLQISEHRRYAMRVIRVERNTKPRGMLITLEHLSEEQRGRQHGPLLLPLPCRPGGLTASFFRACGQVVEPTEQLFPKKCIGRLIHVRFRRIADGACEPADFEASTEETSDDS